MSIASARELVDAAVGSQSAVPAFNVVSLEYAEAIVAGAGRSRTSVILQLSENAIKWHGGRFEPLASACHELAHAAVGAVAIHLDHIEDLDLARHAIEVGSAFGIGSIMFDVSRADYTSNVDATRDLAVAAHGAGMWLEAELGEVGGKDGAHAPGARTDPAEARAFVAATGVDGLAVAVGSSHAMTDRSATLDEDLIRSIAAAVRIPLVLHGSSGVPDDGIRRAVTAGIRKVNVGTALNLAWTAALRAALERDRAAVDPRRYFADGREQMADVVDQLCAVIAG